MTAYLTLLTRRMGISQATVIRHRDNDNACKRMKCITILPMNNLEETFLCSKFRKNNRTVVTMETEMLPIPMDALDHR